MSIFMIAGNSPAFAALIRLLHRALPGLNRKERTPPLKIVENILILKVTSLSFRHKVLPSRHGPDTI